MSEFKILKAPKLRNDTKITAFKKKQDQELKRQIDKQIQGIGNIRPPSSYLQNKKILIIGDSFVRIFQSIIPKDVLIIRYSGSPIKSLSRSFPDPIKSEKEIGPIGKNAHISKKIFFRDQKGNEIFLTYKCGQHSDCHIRVDIDILRELNRDIHINTLVFNFGNVDVHSSYFFKLLENQKNILQDIHNFDLNHFNKSFIQETLHNFIRFLTILYKNFPQLHKFIIILPLYSPVPNNEVIDSILRYPLKNLRYSQKQKAFHTNLGWPKTLWENIISRKNRNNVVDLFESELKTKIESNPKLSKMTKFISAKKIVSTADQHSISKQYSPCTYEDRCIGDFHVFDTPSHHLENFYYRHIFS